MAIHSTRVTLALVAFFVVSALSPRPACAVAVEELVDPRPASFVLDSTGTLSPGDRAWLDDIGRRAAREGTGDLVVAVIGTTGGADPRTFATALYNRWRLDAGTLLLVALDDRAVEINLGDDLDSLTSRRIAQEIVDRELVPRFRSGEPAAAILSGAKAAAIQLLGVRSLLPAEAEVASTEAGATPVPLVPVSVPRAVPDPPIQRSAPEPVAPISIRSGLAAWIFGALLALGSVLAALALWVRRVLGRCGRCRVRWEKLSEAEEDAHLPATAQTEERIGTVFYDVLRCPSCHRHVVRRHARWFTSFDDCPRCRARTLTTDSTELEAPTTRSTGKARIVLDCAHCDFHEERIAILPKESESSSTSGSSSRSSSFSRSGSRSSSFGGSSSSRGRSSGGGASGRW